MAPPQFAEEASPHKQPAPPRDDHWERVQTADRPHLSGRAVGRGGISEVPALQLGAAAVRRRLLPPRPAAKGPTVDSLSGMSAAAVPGDLTSS